MTKDEAIRLAGGEVPLAELLGVTRQAVNKWGDIPQLRLYQLKERKPSWFRVRRAKK